MNLDNESDAMESDTVREMEPEILFQDEDVIVLNKPAGLIMHSDGRTTEPSVAEWVVEQYPEMWNVGEPWVSPQGEIINRPGIVHRLDRTTSGAVILAKHPAAYAYLKEQFQNRTTEKEYRAFVYGHPKEEGGTIAAEITRIRSVPPRWGVKRAGESKKHREAITDWRVLQRGVERETGEKVALLAMLPKTGRTHQIRVHLKHLGYPILCDQLYAAGRPCLLGFDRVALHALKLTIDLPSGERQSFEAPLPIDFENALVRIAEMP